MTDLYTIKGSHFGSLTEPAIRNVEMCEDDCPKSPARVQWRFRTSELTRLVPAPVRSALWNDSKSRKHISLLS